MDQAGDEVHVAPLEREQLALTEAGVGGGAVDRSVLRVPRVRGEQLDLVARVGVELAGVDDGRALDHLARCGVVRDPTLALGALEDAVEHDQVPDDRAVAQRTLGLLCPRVGAVRGPLATPAGQQLLLVRIDVVGGDRIGRHVEPHVRDARRACLCEHPRCGHVEQRRSPLGVEQRSGARAQHGRPRSRRAGDAIHDVVAHPVDGKRSSSRGRRRRLPGLATRRSRFPQIGAETGTPPSSPPMVMCDAP
ncbi:MAG TPA: hypothetical protein VK631_15450 [Solirubrobacteraceae bacterium]|nr:hypothetical protein [Solirubrobacteraceae bacterium]